jgi:hypothetical protein
MNISQGLFSHLYALMRVMPITTGPVLEMGVGIGSTPFLHWACYEKRRLVSYDNNEKYYHLMRGHNYGLHEMHLVDDWDKADILHPWDVVFIDHAPNERRHIDVLRLKDLAKYIVIHDTNPRYDDRYHYSRIYPEFKYIRLYHVARTHVGVLSNFKDLSRLLD